MCFAFFFKLVISLLCLALYDGSQNNLIVLTSCLTLFQRSVIAFLIPDSMMINDCEKVLLVKFLPIEITKFDC